jgi:hypothetical protein
MVREWSRATLASVLWWRERNHCVSYRFDDRQYRCLWAESVECPKGVEFSGALLLVARV